MDSIEPVFPIGGDGALQTGITKREYFASQALIGLISNSHQQDARNQKPLSYGSLDEHVKLAIDYADELIKQLTSEEK